MTHRATLVFTEPLIRRAVFGFWRRTVGVGFLVAMAAVAVSLAALVWHGNFSWVVGALGAVLSFGLAFVVVLYAVHYNNAMRKLRGMGSPQAEFVAEQATFTVSSALGTSTHPWSVVQEVWRFPDCWLLLFSKAQFITLPLACLSSEVQAFILHRVGAAGGKNAA